MCILKGKFSCISWRREISHAKGLPNGEKTDFLPLSIRPRTSTQEKPAKLQISGFTNWLAPLPCRTGTKWPELQKGSSLEERIKNDGSQVHGNWGSAGRSRSLCEHAPGVMASREKKSRWRSYMWSCSNRGGISLAIERCCWVSILAWR